MPRRKLLRDLIWVMAIKVVALTTIYFLFFASPVRIDAGSHLAPALSPGATR